MKSNFAFCFLLAVLPVLAIAQGVQQSAAIASSDVLSQISMFNYTAGRKSNLLLRPTPVIATGEGDVTVVYQDGNATIEAKVAKMPPPTTLGPYTTYVLWALTPDGRAANQGVIGDFEGGKGDLKTQYGASQFALIVTAEPHFGVSAPSTMIVLYNVADRVRADETKVRSLTERADYSELAPVAVVAKTRPVEIVQAQYAVTIAAEAGAEQYAPAQYSAAQEKLAAAQTAVVARSKSDRRLAAGLAREAVIAGEDARRAAMFRKTAADAAAEERRRAEEAAAGAAAAAAAEREAAARSAAAAAEARANAAARQDLLSRLRSVLPTRETDRGLVSEVGGVQFATGTADLNIAARETLARFSGIVASYPDLQFRIEGHTDNTGSDQTNNALSLRRAIAVRDYLIGQGIPASKIDAQGFGSRQPIDDNATSEGRARNRRVEIIISGGLLAQR